MHAFQSVFSKIRFFEAAGKLLQKICSKEFGFCAEHIKARNAASEKN